MTDVFLSPGHYRCPSCEAPEKSFSVFRTAAGVLKGKCHRAACGHWRAIDEAGLYWQGDKPTAGPHSKAYIGEFGTPNLLHQTQLRIQQRFEVSSRVCRIMCDENGAPLLEVFQPNGEHRGYVKRCRFWGEDGPGLKTIAYPDDTRQPWQSWHHADYRTAVNFDRPKGIVLVEDQVSAWKLADNGVTAVALLGSTLNQEKVREIAVNGGSSSEVIIALDADATDRAFEMARTWGMAFRSCRVAILEQDIKDSSLPLKALGLSY